MPGAREEMHTGGEEIRSRKGDWRSSLSKRHSLRYKPMMRVNSFPISFSSVIITRPA